MALFCLNVMGQFHARPGVGTERKHLAWQLVGKGCLALKLDIQMLPWLGSPDWCSPGVWEAVKNWTDVCPGHRLPFSSKKLLSHPCHCSHPRVSAEAEQERPQRCMPLRKSWTQRPEAMLHQSLRVCCVAASLSSAAAVAIVLLRRPRSQNTWFWWVSWLPGSIKQLLY